MRAFGDEQHALATVGEDGPRPGGVPRVGVLGGDREGDVLGGEQVTDPHKVEVIADENQRTRSGVLSQPRQHPPGEVFEPRVVRGGDGRGVRKPLELLPEPSRVSHGPRGPAEHPGKGLLPTNPPREVSALVPHQRVDLGARKRREHDRLPKVSRQAVEVGFVHAHDVHAVLVLRQLVARREEREHVLPVLHRDDVRVVHDEQLDRREKVGGGLARFLELRHQPEGRADEDVGSEKVDVQSDGRLGDLDPEPEVVVGVTAEESLVVVGDPPPAAATPLGAA
mmetsp:Transcript_9710/g.39762  ORF Transcript_9710/g.39762 Transcript_9710/m.39762 type:complete len:281 (+) Transcript_9710:781-1623(+)